MKIQRGTEQHSNNLWAEKPADSKRPFEKMIKQLQAENQVHKTSEGNKS